MKKKGEEVVNCTHKKKMANKTSSHDRGMFRETGHAKKMTHATPSVHIKQRFFLCCGFEFLILSKPELEFS